MSIKGPPRLRFRIKRLSPDGKLKGILLRRKRAGWYACLKYAVGREPLPVLDGAVGIDMGLKKRLALSTSELMEPRAVDQTREDEFRRRVSLTRKASNSRCKAVATLGRETYRNAVRNRNACHRLTTGLVRRYGLLALEDLRKRT